MKGVKHLRILPIVVVAAAALFLVKSMDLLVGKNYPINPVSQARAQNADAETAAADEATGEDAGAGDQAEAAVQDEAEAYESPGRPINLDETSNSEARILQRLGERRDALEKRAAELDLREQLLNATELRVEQRVAELKAIEERIALAEEARDKKETEKLAGLVQMYENMKPKDAAKVFDRLSLDVLVDVVRQMKPRKMSAILAKMSPESAERLTVALATDQTEEEEETVAAPMQNKPSTALPKIEGKPTN